MSKCNILIHNIIGLYIVRTYHNILKQVGGHLLYTGDGFASTTYNSNANGVGTIDIKTPTGAYALLAKNGNTNRPAVGGRCIVIHAHNQSMFCNTSWSTPHTSTTPNISSSTELLL